MNNEVILPRVPPQQTLFPRTPKELCDQIGLQWFAALRLHADDYLSFNPETTLALDESQDAELSFVGTLVVWANDRALLDRLLRGLKKPYQFNLDCMSYDWRKAQWQEFPDPDELEEECYEDMFNDWLADLVARADTDQLDEIQCQVADAIRKTKGEEADGGASEADNAPRVE